MLYGVRFHSYSHFRDPRWNVHHCAISKDDRLKNGEKLFCEAYYSLKFRENIKTPQITRNVYDYDKKTYRYYIAVLHDMNFKIIHPVNDNL
jgi:hypothetical protein